MNIKILNLDEQHIDDLIYICSRFPPYNEPLLTGIKIKKKWLLHMLNNYGSVAKIGYFNDKPVAQIIYYPEIANPVGYMRENVLVLQCVYNPNPETQRKGMAKRLIKSLIDETKKIDKYDFIATYAFETGEYYSQREFLLKENFKPIINGDKEDLYYPLTGKTLDRGIFNPWREPVQPYIPLKEDRNRAIIFYTPTCESSYVFAKKTYDVVKMVEPNLNITLINYWEKPREFLKRNRHWFIVNANSIKATIFNKEQLIKEIKTALKN